MWSNKIIKLNLFIVSMLFSLEAFSQEGVIVRRVMVQELDWEVYQGSILTFDQDMTGKTSLSGPIIEGEIVKVGGWLNGEWFDDHVDQHSMTFAKFDHGQEFEFGNNIYQIVLTEEQVRAFASENKKYYMRVSYTGNYRHKMLPGVAGGLGEIIALCEQEPKLRFSPIAGKEVLIPQSWAKGMNLGFVLGPQEDFWQRITYYDTFEVDLKKCIGPLGIKAVVQGAYSQPLELIVEIWK
ncbi:MAG: hypothetical protein ACOH5I_15105 [Oligoflexus sp.]